jgi:hypothetical protein
MRNAGGAYTLCVQVITPANEPPKSSRKGFSGASSAGDQMIRFMRRHALAVAQVGVIVVCAWVFAGMLDAAAPTEIVGIPVLLTAWAAAFALIDRWVMRRND